MGIGMGLGWGWDGVGVGWEWNRVGMGVRWDGIRWDWGGMRMGWGGTHQEGHSRDVGSAAAPELGNPPTPNPGMGGCSDRECGGAVGNMGAAWGFCGGFIGAQWGRSLMGWSCMGMELYGDGALWGWSSMGTELYRALTPPYLCALCYGGALGLHPMG